MRWLSSPLVTRRFQLPVKRFVSQQDTLWYRTLPHSRDQHGNVENLSFSAASLVQLRIKINIIDSILSNETKNSVNEKGKLLVSHAVTKWYRHCSPKSKSLGAFNLSLYSRTATTINTDAKNMYKCTQCWVSYFLKVTCYSYKLLSEKCTLLQLLVTFFQK